MKPATCTSKYIHRTLTHCYMFRRWLSSSDSHANLNLMDYGTICVAKTPVERQGTGRYGIHNISPIQNNLSSCSLCNICTNSTWQKGKYSLYMTKFRETEASVLKFHVWQTTSRNTSTPVRNRTKTFQQKLIQRKPIATSLVAVRLRSAFKHRAKFCKMKLNTDFVRAWN
jgi:hypothetical protein